MFIERTVPIPTVFSIRAYENQILTVGIVFEFRFQAGPCGFISTITVQQINHSRSLAFCLFGRNHYGTHRTSHLPTVHLHRIHFRGTDSHRRPAKQTCQTAKHSLFHFVSIYGVKVRSHKTASYANLSSTSGRPARRRNRKPVSSPREPAHCLLSPGSCPQRL